ncbi:helix-turn-helix transcriptional regulator [Streptomyces chumphonensis]|uniref:Helix-turn-helix domain-containing protein n=1 Tax=Streptomyces chumphonensis TaxID=1214925 RepID=A0A927EZR4_9ACTN|nr:Scr1 family TA system antitoxin-like transcriptional regulator [Streptomyces chumphonensis]MBD3932375.1 helix-turn-helix domain-containing protein [Streptomyces chumphonensis]
MNQRAQHGNRVSTVLGRKLGNELLRLRDAAGRTQQQAAEALSATATKVVKMERGWVPIRDPDIRALCDFYGLHDPAAVTSLLNLAKLDRERRKAKGWWQQLPKAGALSEYIAMEDVASQVRTWQLAFVPGLFQTAAYARALAVGEGAWDDPDEVERAVNARLQRQRRLHEEVPLHVYAVVWEAALRQVVGGRRVMRAQLDRLREVAELATVRLQVLPFQAGAHACAASSFTIISFTEDEAADVVHTDTIGSTVWAENEEDSSKYRTFFDRTARQALAQSDSLSLIDGIRKEF